MATRRKGPTVEKEPQQFSRHSTPAVPDSMWCSTDVLLGAGMVIIQPATQKVVVLRDSVDNAWFLPRGRKDVGETLEQAALREAYEESGYQVEFLPLYTGSRAPYPPSNSQGYMQPNTEPIYVMTTSWKPRRRGDCGGEYLGFYYVGQIAEDALPEQGSTTQSDEQTYVTHLLNINDALDKLKYSREGYVVHYAWMLWQDTLRIELKKEREAERQQSQVVS